MTFHNDATSCPANVPAPRPPSGNGMAVAGLVLGITSALFCWWGLISLAQIILAIVFSATGIRQANHSGGHKGMAVAGLACGITGCLAYLTIGVSTMGIGFVI